MTLAEMPFRDYFCKFVVLHCTWDRFTPQPEDFPWPEGADGVLVYVAEGLLSGVSVSVICPVRLDTMLFMVDERPERVSRRRYSLGTENPELFGSVEVTVPDQDRVRHLLSEVGWDRPLRLNPKGALADQDLDPLRTLRNIDTFTVDIDCGDAGIVPARVKMTTYEDGVLKGKLLDMLPAGIEIYENDLVEVRVVGHDEQGRPQLRGRKIQNPGSFTALAVQGQGQGREQGQARELPAEQAAALDLWVNGLGDSNKRLRGEDPMPPKHVRATRDSWGMPEHPLRAMPEQHAEFHLGMEITAQERAILECGHIPQVMEDHWFMYCEDDVIRYYRSWTNTLIYEASIEPCDDHYVIGKVLVNRYPGHYRETSIEVDKYRLTQLIAWEIGRA